MDIPGDDSSEIKPAASKRNTALYATLGVLVVIAGASYLFTGSTNPTAQIQPPPQNAPILDSPRNNPKNDPPVTVPRESASDLAKQAARHEEERAEQRREAENRKQQAERDVEAKITAERERQRQQQETQKRAQDDQEKMRRVDAENVRRTAAESKIKQSRTQIETQLRKSSADISNLDQDYLRTVETQRASRLKNEKLNVKAAELVEKSRGSAAAARNQIAYNQKKIQETNLQLTTYQRNPKTSKDLIAQLQQKQAGFQRDITTLQTALTKAEADHTAAQNELNKVDPEAARGEQAISGLLRKRASLAQALEGQVLEIERLRREPDYIEMTKIDGDFDTQKLVDTARQLLAKNLEDSVSAIKSAANTPDPDRKILSDANIVVSNQKTTLYTLKNGRKISSVKSMDAGDSISVKTLGGKFESIKKEDIEKEEVLE